MPNKETLIAQNKWDIFKDKPYEDRTVQASQSSNILRSLQVVGDMAEDDQPKTQGRSKGDSGCPPERSGSTRKRSEYEVQVIKEAFCVVEDLLKYLADYGHHGSYAYSRGKQYLEQLQPLLDNKTTDPCPGCSPGHVCRTPACGRLKLPLDHPLRNSK